MRALLLSLLLLGLSAQAAETTGGLQCEYDGNKPKDPYWKMKKENEDKIALGIRNMGISVGHLPRQDMVTGLNTHLAQLCWTKKSLERIAASITAKKNEAGNLAAGAQGCEAYNGLHRQLTAFQGANRAYDETLAKALREQRGRYQKFIAEDHKALQAHMQDPAVAKSFREAWGKLATEKNFTDAGRKQGVLSRPMAQIEEEQDLNGSRKEGYDNLAGSIQSIKEKCPSLNQIDPMKASAQKPNEWGTDTGTDTSSSSDTSTDTDTDADTGGQKLPPYVPENPDPKDPVVEGPVKEKSGGIGEWAARNKGVLLLGAGTAAVVGGVLWYKHEQDKKQDDWDDWANGQVSSATATATATATSTATSTATDTITSGNNFALSVIGFPPNAAKGQTLGPIMVSVIGPDGQRISDSGIQVTIACASACSLTGTLTKTVTNGAAEFNDLSFTRAETGVQLRVSSPNLNSVASPGSFDVTEAGRE
jgi:hypothetical protein